MATGKSLGKWEVKDCRSFRALSICKKISGPPEPEKSSPKPGDPCPEGWHSFSSGLSCYKVKKYSYSVSQLSYLYTILVCSFVQTMFLLRQIYHLPKYLGAQSPCHGIIKPLVSDNSFPYKLMCYAKEQGQCEVWLS